MRCALGLVLVAVLGGNPALAQPGLPDPAFLPNKLTAEERELLERGPISEGERFGGTLAGLVIGFGMGQAVQGRWRDRGWIFTLGDSVAALAIFGGLVNFSGCQGQMQGGGTKCSVAFFAATGGLLGLGILRLAQTIEAVAVPPSHNDKVRLLRARLATPYVTLPEHGTGALGGVAITF